MTSPGAVSSCLTTIFLTVCVSTIQTTKIPNVHPRPFRVLWNYPDHSCQARNIDLDLSRYGIVINVPRTFVGNEVATLYSSKFGLWPSFQDNNHTKPINGGIPQLANLTAHLEKLRKDIANQIPESSTGYAVIDQEVWRTLYDLNFGVYRVYKHASVTEARNKHGANKNKQQRSAQEEWDKSAREFMERSLLEARALRPDVHWGYYLHPQIWGNADQTRTVNDRMAWLFEASTGIYPSIYLNDAGIPRSEMKQRVESTLGEAIRVRAIYGQANTPIVAYTIVQNNDFFSKDLLDYAIGLHAEMGIDGVIIWGATSMFKPNPTEKCNSIKNYVRDVLGPYVSQLTDKFTNCSISKCGGRGRCMRKDYAQSTAEILEKSSHRRQARPASIQEEIDAVLKQDGYQLRVDTHSHGKIRRFSSQSNRNQMSVWNRTRNELSLAEKSLGDNKNTRTNHALYMFRTKLLRAQTRQRNQPVNIVQQTSNIEDMSKSENNTNVHQSSIVKVEAVRELVHRGFQNSQNTSKALSNYSTKSIDAIVNSSRPVNKTLVINSPRKGLSVEYTGHTLHDKLVDIYNHVVNLTLKQNDTFSLRFDQAAKNSNLTATQMSSKNSLFHNESSVDRPTMSKTMVTTPSNQLPSSRRVHIPDRSVQVQTANKDSSIRIENNKGNQAHSHEEENIHASDPYDNYVCQCYSEWKGPFCEESNGI